MHTNTLACRSLFIVMVYQAVHFPHSAGGVKGAVGEPALPSRDTCHRLVRHPPCAEMEMSTGDTTCQS